MMSLLGRLMVVLRRIWNIVCVAVLIIYRVNVGVVIHGGVVAVSDLGIYVVLNAELKRLIGVGF